MTRRHFFSRTSTGLGIAAQAGLLQENLRAEGGLPRLPHFPPKVKGRNEKLNVSELAAYTTVASLILNMDETVTEE
jgi:hypothetical protein